MSAKRKTQFMNNILDDIFHTEKPVCQIIKTSTCTKRDVFELLRPKPNTCLDYNISQTDLKMDAGPTKIHIQDTQANYVPDDKQPQEKKKKKKKRRRKIKYFSGGPPQWEFWDEKWRREVEEKQKIYHQELEERLAKAASEKREKRRQAWLKRRAAKRNK